MNRNTQIHIASVVTMAAVLVAVSLPNVELHDSFRFGGFLLVSLLASMFKVRIPGLTGTYSLNFIVLLAAVSELSRGELLLIALASAVTQSYWRAARRPQLVQVAFNASNLVISVASASALFHATRFWQADWLLLSGGLAALVYYFLNIGLTAIVLCLVQGGTLGQMWQHWSLYTLPYYLLGSTLSIGWIFCRPQIHWQGLLVVVFFLYLVFWLFRNFVSFREGVRQEIRLGIADH